MLRTYIRSIRNESSSLLPILRSQHQAQVLALLLLHPDREYTVTELAKETGIPISTLHDDVQRLVKAGILRDRRVGRARLVRANSESRLMGPLAALMTLTYGPPTIIAEEFGELEDVDLVLIFGSWAARYRGQDGPSPNDIDVLVVGNPSRGSVYDAAERASKRLGMAVQPVIGTRQRWESASDALIQQIKSSATFTVVVVDRGARDDQ